MKRKDGRSLEELRRIRFVKSPQKDPLGSVLVEWGQTHVICSVNLEEKSPIWMKDKQGWITAEYGMLPGSSDKRISREKSRTNGRTHEIQRLIGRSLRAAFPLERMGERTFTVDCDVIQADGGTRVASITGAYLAMQLALFELKKKSLLQNSQCQDVCAVSMGILKNEVFTDLAYVEDVAADVDANIVMLGNGEFVEIQATGEKRGFRLDEWQKLLGQAQNACQQVFELQRAALKEWGVLV